MKYWFVLAMVSTPIFGLLLGQAKTHTPPSAPSPLITFVELGSVNCIPCKAMQPVMRSIESRYGSQIKVVFHDVWKNEESHFAHTYKVRLIPTQVFLDASGKEIHRHEGYYPEKEIDAFLQSKGLKALQ